MKEYSTHQNSMQITAESKGKKGDGVKAALTLMQDLRDFQEKISTCVEAQDIADNKQKIEQFEQYVQKMYDVLLDIAGTGIKSVRKPEQSSENNGKNTEYNPPMVSYQQINKLP